MEHPAQALRCLYLPAKNDIALQPVTETRFCMVSGAGIDDFIGAALFRIPIDRQKYQGGNIKY
ncbi:hypothetical protein [Rhodoferax sp. WC2427]|uniref:hypothetical protein n=1 Tax=Rhodoferax sp. WC2427 TaxID=3234144 RepID=UPI003465FB3B